MLLKAVTAATKAQATHGPHPECSEFAHNLPNLPRNFERNRKTENFWHVHVHDALGQGVVSSFHLGATRIVAGDVDVCARLHRSARPHYLVLHRHHPLCQAAGTVQPDAGTGG